MLLSIQSQHNSQNIFLHKYILGHFWNKTIVKFPIIFRIESKLCNMAYKFFLQGISCPFSSFICTTRKSSLSSSNFAFKYSYKLFLLPTAFYSPIPASLIRIILPFIY